MAGLIEKDLRLLSKRKQAILVFIFISIMVGYTGSGSFILGYMPMLFTILIISTISYDETENGFTFIFSLPVDVKTYVSEKYILCIGAELVSFVFAYVILVVMGGIRGIPVDFMATLPINLIYIPIVAIIATVTIPVQLKFGMEASRVAIIGVFGVFAVIVFLVTRLVDESVLDTMYLKLESLPSAVLTGCAVIITAIIVGVSYGISLIIMKRKEF